MAKRVWRMLLASVLLLPAAACERDGARDDRMAAADTTMLEDRWAIESMLGPIRAVSRAEVEYGQLAAQRAGSPSVRQYGQTIATDHRALMTVLDSVARSRGVTLPETGEAQELANLVRMAHSGLENLQGEAFDLPFVRAEVESHRQLLDRLDQRAIPAASSPELQEMLRDIRAMADAHLMRARQLLAEQLGESIEPPPDGQQPRAPATRRPLGTPTDQ